MECSSFLSGFDPQRELVTPNRLFFDCVDSTNRVARRLVGAYLESGQEPPPTLILALRQRAGKGRLGRPWISPPGGLYVSLITGRKGAAHVAQLPMTVGAALCAEIDCFVESPCRLKWPNDLIIAHRKIGGILIETCGVGEWRSAIIGFGINYSTQIEIPGKQTTTLVEECDSPPPLPELASKLIAAVEVALNRSETPRSAMARFARWSSHREGEWLCCSVAGQIRQGFFQGFDELGFLRLNTATGEERIAAGDVVEHCED